jgi:hypothetical protein
MLVSMNVAKTSLPDMINNNNKEKPRCVPIWEFQVAERHMGRAPPPPAVIGIVLRVASRKVLLLYGASTTVAYA